MRHIKNRIKEMRQNTSLTQEDLANKINVSRQTIIAIEKGNYTPSLLLAFQIAKEFNMKVDEVFWIG